MAWQLWLPGFVLSGVGPQIGTGTSPAGLKAFAPFQGGIRPIFIGGGELEKYMGHSSENAFLNVGAALRAAIQTREEVVLRRAILS